MIDSPPAATSLAVPRPWGQAWLQHPKIPLVLSLLLQATGLLWFLGVEVSAFVGEDEVGPIARLYENPFASRIAFYAATALAVAVVLLRAESWLRRGLVALILMVSAATGWGFITLLMYPLLLADTAAPVPAARDGPAWPWDTLAWGVLLGGFYLMTQQLPFPHDTPRILFYVFSYSVVYHLLLAVAAGALFAGLHAAVSRSGLPAAGRFAALNWGVPALVYGAVYASIRSTFADIASQFDLPALPFILSSLLATVLLFFLAAVRPGSWAQELTFLHRPLTARRFWIKFVLLFLAVRSWIDWLVDSHRKDFLYEFSWDVTNLVFPVFALLVSLALCERLLRRARRLVWSRAAAVLIFASAIAFLLWNVNDPALLLTERNRAMATFVSRNVRSALATVGLERTSGPIARHLEQVETRLRDYSAQPLTATDVFPETRPAALSALPEIPALGFQPHIFVFVSDATAASHLSVYGYRRDTSPNLVRFAQHAAVFDHYYTSGTSTHMGMRAMFTGTYIGRNTAGDPVSAENLCRALARNGYRLFLDSVANILSLLNPPSECATYSILRDHTVNPEDWADIAAQVQAHPNRPVFYYLYVHGGHTPWKIDAKDQIFGADRIDLYDAMLRIADTQFGDMLARIDALGILERSVIVYTSDHGIGLGQHYDMGSYSNLYNPNAQLPFVIRVPKGAARHVENQYSQSDFRPSLEALMGYPRSGTLHGISFAPELYGPVPPRERCTYSIALHRPRYSVQCSDGRKLIYYAKERTVEIFNERADPNEATNLALRMSPEQAAPLAEALARFLAFGRSSYAILR